MHVAKITVSSDYAATRRPFIYMGLIQEFNALYIGETFSHNGLMGRAAQHISLTNSSTFRKRVCEVFNYGHVNLSGIVFHGSGLSEYRGFWQTSNEYRRAVEFLVQMRIMNFLAENKMPYTPISRVTSNGYCATSLVVQESTRISDEFIIILSNVNDEFS